MKSSSRLKLYESEENKEQILGSTMQNEIIQKCLRNSVQMSKMKIYF